MCKIMWSRVKLECCQTNGGVGGTTLINTYVQVSPRPSRGKNLNLHVYINLIHLI